MRRLDERYHGTAREACCILWKGRDLCKEWAGDRGGGVEDRRRARRERSECSSMDEVSRIQALWRDREWGSAERRREW